MMDVDYRNHFLAGNKYLSTELIGLVYIFVGSVLEGVGGNLSSYGQIHVHMLLMVTMK